MSIFCLSLLLQHTCTKLTRWLHGRRLLPVAAVALFVLSFATPAQGQPVQGVVWQLPPDAAEAVRGLDSLQAAGVQAVRTGLVTDTTVLVHADTLGIQLFQEVPIDYLPATGLSDTLDAVARLMQPALRRARGHPSARHFGLARRSDTSDPAACSYFQSLSELVDAEGPSNARTYYLSTFVENDRCADAVDFVLLDALREDDPAALLRRRAAVDSLQHPIGIGALGTYVDPDATPGLKQPHSPQWQARFLEETLTTLLSDTLTVRPEVVFVYRWRDEQRALPLEPREADLPTRRNYGLLHADGTPRPAHHVVEGIYTGRQTVFAFSAGDAPTDTFPWFIVAGWIVFAGVGLSYTLSPRMQRMAPRYFTAGGFYRDAVREGRELMEGATAALLALLAVSVAVTLTLITQMAAQHEVFWISMRWLPDDIYETLMMLVDQPWLMVLIITAVYIALALLWVTLLALLTRGRRTLSAGQALVLVVWPRWTYLLVMVAALIISAMPTAQALQALPYVAGALLLFQCYAALRTLRDYKIVALIPPSRLVAAAVLNPFVILLVILSFTLLQYRHETVFLWHMVTQT